MAKFVWDAAYDAQLASVADATDYLCVCSAQPTTYTEAYTTYMLAKTEVAEGDGNGDFTIADNDGTGAGRMLTVAAQPGVTITNSGDGVYVALVKTSTSELVGYTPCAKQTLVAGETTTFPTFALRVPDVV